MAKTKKADKEFYDRLRSSGVRKKVASKVSNALPTNGGGKSQPARKAAAQLNSAADEIKDRVKGGPQKRSESAKKAAKTRRENASKRSKSAKKAARTRAKT